MHSETHIQAMNGHSHCFCLVGGGNLYSFEFLLTSHYVIKAASEGVGVEMQMKQATPWLDFLANRLMLFFYRSSQK